MNDDQFDAIKNYLKEDKKWVEIYKIFSFWFPSTTILKKSFMSYRQRYDP